MQRCTHGGARKGAGRPAGKPDTKPRKPRTEGGRHKRQVVLDDETLAIWDALEGDRSAWVRSLILAAIHAPAPTIDTPPKELCLTHNPG